ncbi:MAG: hypothetical protein ACYCVN_02085 [Acidimicrobiales bacterium]
MRRYFTLRCIGLHLTILVLLPLFAWLTAWQYGRAIGGNTLSWAYTFEWPLFAGYAVYIWWQLINDQPTALARRDSASGASSATGDDATGADVHQAEEREPGWALVAGKGENSQPSSVTVLTPRHSRIRAQTPEEEAALAEYNRYLAELSGSDADASNQ